MSAIKKRGRLLCVGRPGSEVARVAAEKAAFYGIEILELPDFPDHDILGAIRRESDVILEKIGKKDRVVLFDLSGSPVSESVLAEADVWVIGGSNGVDERVRHRANKIVKVSNLTYPHGLFRLLALELIGNSKKDNRD